MKNTPENKAKFFAQYWGQEVMVVPYHSTKLIPVHVYQNMDVRQYSLELKPLSQITDEDALELFNLISPDWKDCSNEISFGKAYASGYDEKDIERAHTTFEALLIIDFLRSKGYAIPYMGISVEQQMEWGWVKLKE